MAWVDSASEVLLVLVVVGSALAVGTVHIEVLLVVSAAALVGGTLSAMALQRLPKPAIVLGALGLFSAVQAIPLPATLVRRLSPVSAEVWLRSLAPFGEHELLHFPLSLDAGASIAEALKWLTYAAVYLMAVRVRAQRSSTWLATLLFVSVGLVTLITLAHGVADARVLYGVYQPNFLVARWNVGPLLNSNNMAGYALLGLAAGTGLLLSRQTQRYRAAVLFGLAVICTALFLSGSRAAVLCSLIGATVTLLWLIRVQRVRLATWQFALGIAPLLAGVALAIALGTRADWGALTSLDAQRKIAGWTWSLPMIRDHLWVGVGRGAFETAFPPYRQALDYDWTAVFTHAENFVLQWLAEWGLPVGVGATLTVVGYVLSEWYLSRSDRLRFMLMTGLVALLAQNLADLGLEVPAVAIGAIVALAAGERSSPRPSSELSKRLGLAAFAAAAPMLVIWVAATLWSRLPVERERREFALAYRALHVESPEERAMFRDELHDATLRHPGESFFPLLGSLVAIRAREGSPLPWLSRALELSPTNGHVHLVLAQLLGAHGATRQAMLHLRLAAQYDRTLAGIAGLLAVRWAPSIEILLQAIPDGPAGDTMLVDACKAQPQVELKIACFRQATVRKPSDAAVQGQLANSLLAALSAQQWPCAGAQADNCVQEVDRTARLMSKLEPTSWRPGYLLAKLLLARGDAKGAIQLLARVCPSTTEGNECAREAVTAAIRSGSNDAIVTAANAYAPRACENSAACADSLDWLASTLGAGGKLPLAIDYYAKAAEIDGSAARWLKVAEQASRAHLYGIARTALNRADHSPDASPNSRAHTALLMQRVAQSLGSQGL